MRVPDTSAFGNVFECSVPLVAQEPVRPEIGQVKVRKTIVVIITYCYAETEPGFRQPGSAGYVFECPVAFISVQAGRRLFFGFFPLLMPGTYIMFKT